MSTRSSIRYYEDIFEGNDGKKYIRSVHLYREMHDGMVHLALEDDRSNSEVNIVIPEKYKHILKRALQDGERKAVLWNSMLMNHTKVTEKIKKEAAEFVRALHSLSETELEEYMQYIMFTTKEGRAISVTMPPILSEKKISCEMILPIGENENE